MDVPLDPTDRRLPAITAGPLAEERHPVLLWVHTGTATVEAAGICYPLSAGEAIWVPPRVVHCTRTDEGAVVFPIFPVTRALPATLSRVRRIAIPPGWENWLIVQHLEAFHIGRHLRDPLPGAEPLLDLIAAVGSCEDDAPWRVVDSLPVPRSPAARNVASALLRDPALPWPAGLLADREHVSVKTLQRQFQQETGMVFSAWRTRARVVVAAKHLAEGRDIGWTRRHVGFVTPSGFTKAFRRYVGATPRAYAQDIREHGTRGTMMPTGGHTAALTENLSPEPPAIPPSRTWPRVNDCHVLLWVYEGEAEVRIGSHHHRLRRGEAVWLPAGVPNTIAYAADSVVVPVGSSHSRARLRPEDLTVVAFPPAAAPRLLHASIVEYTLFRPESDDRSFVEQMFRAQFLAQREATANPMLTGAVGIIAQALRRDPTDSRTLTHWAERLRTSAAELGAEFHSQTGKTFPQWRAQLRMDLARVYLQLGDAPGEVAARLGYASPAAFANAFAATHQMSAREYQRREAEPTTLAR